MFELNCNKKVLKKDKISTLWLLNQLNVNICDSRGKIEQLGCAEFLQGSKVLTVFFYMLSYVM